MKKVLMLVLVMLLCLTMVACGGDSNTSDSATPGATVSTKEKTPSGKDVTVDEQVIFEQDGITVTVKSLDFSGLFGPELKVLAQNGAERNATIQVRDVSVNGVMVESMFSCDVVAGKSANDTITLMKDSLNTAGIETIKEIEFKLHIFDTDSWEGNVDSDVITIMTTADEAFMQEYDDSGEVVLDQNGIKVVLKGLDTESGLFGTEVNLYIENNSEQNITVQARNTSVNGFMIEPLFSTEVVAGKKALTTMTFMETNLTENDISDIQTIELSWHVFDTNSWDDIFTSDTIVLTF